MPVIDTDMELIDQEQNQDTLHGKYLVFFLDSQEFAIAIRYVVDIINIQPITPMPNVPGYIKGITNLRGKVIPIIDVRLRFSKEPQEYNDRTCIVVVELGDIQVGLVIDQVSEVCTFSDDQIAPPPAFNTSAEARFVQGIGKAANGIKLILDCRMVLDDALVDMSLDEAVPE